MAMTKSSVSREVTTPGIEMGNLTVASHQEASAQPQPLLNCKGNRRFHFHSLRHKSSLRKQKTISAQANPEPPGLHLASGDKYRIAIVQHQKRNPNLKYRDWKVPINRRTIKSQKQTSDVELPSRVKLIRLGQDGAPTGGAEDFGNSQDLANHLCNNRDANIAHGSAPARSGSPSTGSSTAASSGASSPAVRNLYILEGLNPDFVELIGSHFNIDPSFFSRHQRTALWDGRDKGGNTAKLASIEDSSQSFMMEYCEILYFATNREEAMRNPHDNRHIDMSARPKKLSSNLDRVGNMHRKASFWSRDHSEGGWDALIIVDPPLPTVPDQQDPQMKTVLVGSSKAAKPMPLEVALYQGGYLDFIRYSTLTEDTKELGPERTSIMDDLCFYWEWHSKSLCPDGQPNASVILATIFLQKIIASNYMILVGYLEACLNELELAIRLEHVDKGTKDMTLTISEQWSVLQTWSHRFPEYCAMLEDILQIHENLPPSKCSGGDRKSWDNCTRDFRAISTKMDKLRSRTEILAESFVGLASMAGMQESLDEARNVRILTFLGIFFLPLSWIASIFAITERPDPKGFPLYCKTAFPTAVALTIICVVYVYATRRFKAIKQKRA